MKCEELRPNKVLRGPLFPEPVQVLIVTPMGAAVKLIGKGLNTSKLFDLVLTHDNLTLLETTPEAEPFDGDSKMFRLPEMMEMQQRGDTSQPLAANIKQTEDRIDELNARLEHRRAELERERECMIGDIQHVARAWVLPHPERQTPQIAAMVADPEIERIAVQFAIRHEEAEGRVVESVETENRGFDLISRKPHPEDPKTAIDVRFIEVKGRADTGDIALTSNEYNTAKRLKKDYYLYIVLHCATAPSLNILQDPAILDWQPIVKVEHYRLRQDSIKHPVELKEDPTPYRTGGNQCGS